MLYELFVCIGVSVMGCGNAHIVPVQSKEECFEILREMRIQERGKNSTGEDTTDSLAYCRPKRAK